MTILFPHAFKFLGWEAMFPRPWGPAQVHPGTRMERSWLWTWACLSAVSWPTANASEKEISVTQFADCLPRGHDLSLILVPSSPDVLDSVWNVHARNPGKWQPFHKGSSDLVVRWEPSGRSHLLSSHGSAGQSSWGNPSMMGSSQTSLGKDTCGSTRAPAMFRPLPGQICFFL